MQAADARMTRNGSQSPRSPFTGRQSAPMSTNPKLKKLAEMRAAAEAGGGSERVAKIHESGRLTARERINLLFDPATFQELGVFVTHRATDFGIADNRP